jgi:hypothetical protein
MGLLSSPIWSNGIFQDREKRNNSYLPDVVLYQIENETIVIGTQPIQSARNVTMCMYVCLEHVTCNTRIFG